jgi:hypothetical protein
MVFTEVENAMAVVIGWLVMAEGSSEVLKMLLHMMLFGVGLRGFFDHFIHVVCLPGD